MARILIVEDLNDVRLTLRDIVEADGHVVDEAEDGSAAIDRLLTTDPDIVIIDLVMPRIDGFDAIQRIRKMAPGVRILALTGGGWRLDLDYLGLARICGADAAIGKPVEVEQFRKVVRDLLSRGS